MTDKAHALLQAAQDPATVERFWKAVRTLPSGCWTYRHLHRSRKVRISTSLATTPARFAYLVQHGPIPHHAGVLRACANKACCNPHHLTLDLRTDRGIGLMHGAARGQEGATAPALTAKTGTASGG